MPQINKVTSGSLAKSNKLNEVIQTMNALANMTVRAADGEEAPKLIISDNNSTLITSGGGGGGGALPEGYVETSVTLCQNGSPVEGSILFKAD
mgnify:CR=1 FL=1